MLGHTVASELAGIRQAQMSGDTLTESQHAGMAEALAAAQAQHNAHASQLTAAVAHVHTLLETLTQCPLAVRCVCHCSQVK